MFFLNCFTLIRAYSLDAQTGIQRLRPSGYTTANLILIALAREILTRCS